MMLRVFLALAAIMQMWFALSFARYALRHPEECWNITAVGCAIAALFSAFLAGAA